MTKYGAFTFIFASNIFLTFICSMIELSYINEIDPEIIITPSFTFEYAEVFFTTLFNIATFQVEGLPSLVSGILGLYFYVTTALLIFIIVNIVRGV